MTNEAEQSELIAAYITGGLSADERLRVERRAAADPAFAAQLEEFMALDLSLKQSAGVESVLAGLEDRLTAAVEAARPVTRFAVHPLVRKAAVATAACLLLGTAGYFASTAMEQGQLPLWREQVSFRRVSSDAGRVKLADSIITSGRMSNEAMGQVRPIDDSRSMGEVNGRGITAFSSDFSIEGDLDAAKMLEKSDEIRKREAALGRDLYGYIPDFSDAPSFNLQTTSGVAGGGGGGGDGGGLFGARRNTPLLDPYAPGSTIKPFKPSQLTIGGTVAGNLTTETFTAPSGKAEKDLRQNAGDYTVTGNVTGGREFRGRTVPSDPTSFRGGAAANQRTGQGQDGQNALYRDGHAELKDQPAGSRVVQQPELQVTDTRNGVSVPDGGTLLLGGQTLTGELSESQRKTMDAYNKALADNAPTTRPGAGNGTAVVVDARKIIRSGEMVFEIDRFDSAAATIGKIVGENGGLIATTNSDKLPNGKVRGSIIVRIPPDKLDTFILQLRALGDLKSQRLGSADVTKEYYDLASELRAARAMEQRLLEMIQSGKGEIKDLLEAEKELANWRGKIEKIIGQTKYYDNLVSLATLTITLQERDIAAAAASIETEAINSGIETDDVEKARGQALEILKDAKARVISSNLNKLDAGQVAATIVADIPPDQSGAVVDRLKQLGKVARLEVAKSMTADANAATSAAPKTERKDSRLTLSLYNVANVQPRVTTSIELASADAAAAYRALADKALKAGGRVVKGGATQPRGSTGQADGVFEVPAESAEAFLAEIKSAGDVISQATSESPDTANVTTSKRGFTVSITPAASLPARRSASLRIETADVEAASANLQTTLLAAGGRVLDASNATDPTGQSIARVVMDVPLAKSPDLLAAARGLGTVRAITSGENAAAPAGALAKARLEVTFATPGRIVSEEGGLGANLRHGLSISARGLVFSAKMIVVGLCFVLPWAIVLWAGLKLFKRRRTAPAS